MSLSVALGCLWLVVANVIAMFPSRHHHWPAAYALIAIGVPLLVWVIAETGPWIGLAFVVAGASVLRWPVRYLIRWFLRRMPGSGARDGA